MKWLRFLGKAGVTLFAMYVLLVLGWIYVRPKVKVVAVRKANELYILVTPNFRVNAVLGVFVWKEGADEYACVVKDIPRGNVSINCGQVSLGDSQNAPPNGIAPPLTGSILVEVEYQYDDWDACAGSDWFTFVVTNEGEVGPVTKIQASISPRHRGL